MAASYRTDVATWNTTAGAKTATITTVAGDYLIALTAHTSSAPILDHAVTDDQGGVWYRAKSFSSTTASNGVMNFWVRTKLVETGASTIVTTTPNGTSTGGGLDVIAVSGMLREGMAGVRQTDEQEQNNAAAPDPDFPFAPLTENMIIGFITAADNPIALTERAGFTERQELSYGTPAFGMHVMTRDSGETAVEILWGSSTTGAYGSLIIELDIRPPDAVHIPNPVLNTVRPISLLRGPPVLLKQSTFVPEPVVVTDIGTLGIPMS